MASLKELRNRISSVQATQKITRAMQMVAASKLRRAQEAAEAARPYAERMGACWPLAAGITDAESAPPLLAGTGKRQTPSADRRHRRARPVRRLQHGIIARLARLDAAKLQAEGKQVQILCVGRKGHDALKRYFDDELLDPISYQEPEKRRLCRSARGRRPRAGRFRRRCVRCLHAVLLEV